MPDANGNLSPMEAIVTQEQSLGRPLTQEEANTAMKANDDAIKNWALMLKAGPMALYALLALAGVKVVMKLY